MAPLSIPSSFVPSAATSRPSTVPDTAIFPVTVAPPSASSSVPFINLNAVLVNLAVITFEPAFLCANSIIPSSVPELASLIFPVIFA